MADSNALLLSVCAHTALKNMGLPEGNIPLSHAIIYVCEAPKSNSVIRALESVESDVKNIKDDNVPNHLKNHPVSDKQEPYKYPHNYGGYVKQQYLPDKLKNKIYYVPSQNGKEKGLIRKKVM